MGLYYFDNAATSFPKAPGVAKSISDYITNIGVNIGRSSYAKSIDAANVVYETRTLLCRLFNFENPLNVVFTKNITESINVLLKGYLKPHDRVIVSSMEHNAVMRPLRSLEKCGIIIDTVNCNNLGCLDINDLKSKITEKTSLIIMTHASNVCGTMLPAQEIGKLCKVHNIPFILDSAQTAGIIDIDFKKMNLSALAFTGHKGLLGPQGIGGFILSNNFCKNVSPLIEGGTGSFSESEFQPSAMPDKFEGGTLNIPGIYGLNAALKYVLKTKVNTIYDIESDLTGYFIKELLNIKEIHLFGIPENHDRTSVISVGFNNMDNSEAAFMLDKNFGIMTRVGLHCAPSAHKTIGSFPKGTVRFSLSHFQNKSDIDYAISSINKICKLK